MAGILIMENVSKLVEIIKLQSYHKNNVIQLIFKYVLIVNNNVVLIVYIAQVTVIAISVSIIFYYQMENVYHIVGMAL